MKMYIINACAKTPETLRKKQDKVTVYNVIIVPMKNPCRENQETYFILY
jgi:hypothetical protein